MTGEDRRRVPRFVPEQGLEVQLSLVTGFQVLELSAAGMLLSSDRAFVAGERTQVHTMLADEPFSARVEVKAVRQFSSGQGQASNRHVIAAAFVSFDHGSDRTLRRFLSRAAPRGSLREARERTNRRGPGRD